MRKFSITLWLSSIAAIVALCSCTKDESALLKDYDASSISIEASIDQPVDDDGTKTTIGAYVASKGYPVLWSAGDVIAVSPKTGKDASMYTLDGEGGKMTGKFKATGVVPVTQAYAFYPFTMVLGSIDKNIYNVLIPSKQTYSENSFAKNVMPMYAKTDDISEGLNFQPLMSVLKIQLTGSSVSVKKIFVSDISGKVKLSGLATVDMETGKLTISEGMEWVELDCPEPVALTGTPKAFHIVVPAATSAYRVKIVTSDGKVMNKTISSREYKTALIKKMEAVAFAKTDEFPYKEGSFDKKGVIINGVVWAPANCGQSSNAASNGLFYQWGRKFGFPLTGEVTTTSTPASNMAAGNADGVKNKFYTTSVSSCWYSGNNHYDRWWSNYDPCPEGWRVPTKEELDDLLAAGYENKPNHKKFGTGQHSIDLQNAGYRNFSDGAASTEGGYYLSSTAPSSSAGDTYAVNAWTLGWSNASAAPAMSTELRSYGSSVRCVQE